MNGKRVVHYADNRPSDGNPGDRWIQPYRGGDEDRRRAFLVYLRHGQPPERHVMHEWQNGDWREVRHEEGGEVTG